MSDFTVTVIIPTYKRGKYLVEVLKCLIRQTYPPIEILIVDQTEKYTKEEWNQLKKFLNLPIVHYIQQREPNAQKARNKGIDTSRGDIILFLDDDIIFQDNLIENHVRNYNDINIDGVVGQVLYGNKNYSSDLPKEYFHRKYGWLYFPHSYDKRMWIISVSSNNFSLRKKVIEKGIRFDETFSGSTFRDDADLSLEIWRNGFQLIYDPQCSIIEQSAPYGGMRQGVRSKYIQPISYIKGECYFILKNFGIDCWFPLLWKAYRRYVLFKRSLKSPYLFIKLNIRWTIALFMAANGAYQIRKQNKNKYPWLTPDIMVKVKNGQER